jgi:hypothetical protein
MNHDSLKAFVSRVIDESAADTITAAFIAGEAYEHFDLPDEFNYMHPREAMSQLKEVAAEVLREKYEANATPEHIQALKEYGASKKRH